MGVYARSRGGVALVSDSEPEERDEDEGIVVATVEIQMVLNDDGDQVIWLRHYDNNDDNLPLITVIGMLEMSKDTAYKIAALDRGEEGDSE